MPIYFSASGQLGSLKWTPSVGQNWGEIKRGSRRFCVGYQRSAWEPYIFERDSEGTWNQVKKLTASDGAAGDQFVSISEDAVVVGVPRHDSEGVSNSGAAYVFEGDSDSTWR